MFSPVHAILRDRAAEPQLRIWRAVPMGPRIGAGATSRDLARRSRGRAKRVRSRGPRRHQHLCPKAKHPIMKLTIERAALLKSLPHVQRSEEHTSELQSLMRNAY